MHCVGGSATSILTVVYSPSAKKSLKKYFIRRREQESLVKFTLPPNSDAYMSSARCCSFMLLITEPVCCDSGTVEVVCWVYAKQISQHMCRQCFTVVKREVCQQAVGWGDEKREGSACNYVGVEMVPSVCPACVWGSCNIPVKHTSKIQQPGSLAGENREG